MKLSLNWIQDFIDLSDLSLEDILHKVNASICETEEAVPYLPHLKTIIPVKILSLDSHPQADKLQVAKVTDGSKEIQIVTGAKNVAVGDIVPLATPGTILGDKLIEKSLLRSVESSGMLCSQKEISIGEDDSGVFVLDSNYPLGKPFSEILQTEDTIIDIDNKSITHRPDLWSHFGFARELASQFGKKLKFNPLLDESWDSKLFTSKESSHTIKQNENVHGYYVSSFHGVNVNKSSWKFQSRLQRCGMKSISNVVDVSNYLLLECGQPTHFFDLDKLPGTEFEASFANDKESFPLLDDTSPSLESSVLLIRSGGQAVAIAGVMGGKDSSVTNTTKNLVLESAVFKREDVRKSIRKSGIRSDSAIRYEKGLDSSTCLPIIRRAIQLLRENGNPDCTADLPFGFDHNQRKQVIIATNVEFIQKKLGKAISEESIVGILTRLNFKVEQLGKGNLQVRVPWFRHNYDVTLPEDLVEEVGRTIGYASIETKSLELALETPLHNAIRSLERKCKSIFSLKFGYNEVFNYSFASIEDTSFEEEFTEENTVRLLNEMPAEHSVLRTSMYPSILRNAKANQDRYDSFGIFEVGRTYDNRNKDKDGLPLENRFLSFLKMDEGRLQNEDTKRLQEHFLILREQVTKLFHQLGLKDLEWKIATRKHLHPNACLVVYTKEQEIAELGILHNREVDRFDLRKRVVMGKIHITSLESILSSMKESAKFIPPSQFPQGQLDISLVLDQKSSTFDYAKALQTAGIEELDKVWVHDTFSGGNLDEGKVSVTYRVSLLPYEKTFTQERLKEISDRMIAIANEMGYNLR